MPLDVIDVQEFGETGIRVARLIENGELTLDPRIQGKGYLNVSLARGQVVFRADRYVGLIPVSGSLAIRVRPRANISNLSYMIARSGVAPVAIPSFSRGYLPRFEGAPNVERIYRSSLLAGVQRITERGLIKAYTPLPNPPRWRGRLLASETVRRFASKGIKYRHVFDFSTLSINVVENIALKMALLQLLSWLRENDKKSPDCETAERLLKHFSGVQEWEEPLSRLVTDLGRRIPLIPPQLGYYRDPLWMAFLLLQRSLPDVGADGSVELDSLVIDISKVFEAYTRRCLVDRAEPVGWNVRDGNLKPSTFFTDNGTYEVRPDIVVAEGAKPIAVLDAKYKPSPKETDRYELLSFMDAVGVSVGAFICPGHEDTKSHFLGTTAGGKKMSVLRFDLDASNPEAEADRFFQNVRRLIEDHHAYD